MSDTHVLHIVVEVYEDEEGAADRIIAALKQDIEIRHEDDNYSTPLGQFNGEEREKNGGYVVGVAVI